MASPHHKYLQSCLALAEKSPPRPTNFRVGAILVSRKAQDDLYYEDDRVLSTGYTMELEGNTHAEQCCLSKYAAAQGVPDDRIAEVLPSEAGRQLVMYVTMEPCGKRLSGNQPCVQRIVDTRRGDRRGVEKVYFGVKEPETFVGASETCRRLTDAGIQWRVVQGLEKNILSVATAGHENSEEEVRAALDKVETRLDDVSEDERERQRRVPRNPKKRMVEVDLLG
ncbi:cytidine and deoxycytidylate deaminase zinc-binding domain protein [Aspergillus campestris IBT 28561]|uniref:Cytidine and deoxycytidylate deaminase zinc-binding domain protein n=1 Tax=Aspergillus campestris (strain IBT 28561) TaxID=1392248 RepID=A0A2I1D3K6_ASPC2|nr:cytidine and deoxycytidylate deaminase zinc-binding domain protein [Aspergillus campestris IBT 28561]PKY04455.1 cytidine and deoxycytidylate deaminase zinc-binding domain protein [Aspergillus campestris IBT 28561]